MQLILKLPKFLQAGKTGVLRNTVKKIKRDIPVCILHIAERLMLITQ